MEIDEEYLKKYLKQHLRVDLYCHEIGRLVVDLRIDGELISSESIRLF